MGEGKRGRDIAAPLGVSPRIVHHHLEQIDRKVDAETRAAAAVQARVTTPRGS